MRRDAGDWFEGSTVVAFVPESFDSSSSGVVGMVEACRRGLGRVGVVALWSAYLRRFGGYEKVGGMLEDSEGRPCLQGSKVEIL